MSSNYLSYGITNLLSTIQPGKRRKSGTIRFPSDWHQSISRKYNGPPGEWFENCLNDLSNSLDNIWINKNFICFFVLKWSNYSEINYLCLHSIVTQNHTLEDLYIDPKKSCQYFRIEVHESQFGPFYKEPYPHIHIGLDGEPRFGLNIENNCYVLQEFFEFIYRNYFFDEWLSWCRDIYIKKIARKPSDVKDFNKLIHGFNSGNLKFLEQESSRLKLFKEKSKKESKEQFNLYIPKNTMEVLNY